MAVNLLQAHPPDLDRDQQKCRLDQMDHPSYFRPVRGGALYKAGMCEDKKLDLRNFNKVLSDFD